ncbi:MAG TPA: hypothetical protein VLE96_03890 [Chlamydiales bacterium]|nr:hypothetical protein [Chlamydiales bacterium]
MTLITNDVSNNFLDFLPEMSSTTKNVVKTACGIAGILFLGYKAYGYFHNHVEQSLREKVADYIVIGCTRDFKLSEEEMALKGEAIAVRKKICSLFQEIVEENIQGLTNNQQQELKNISALVNTCFTVLDTFIANTQATKTLPFWWTTIEPTIKAEILNCIQVRYSSDPAMKPKKIQAKENLNKQLDLIAEKIISKNNLSTAQQLLLKGAIEKLKNKL